MSKLGAAAATGFPEHTGACRLLHAFPPSSPQRTTAVWTVLQHVSLGLCFVPGLCLPPVNSSG